MANESEDKRAYAPATARNRKPILEVMRERLPRQGLILEIASGSGEHAAWLAPRLEGITWQPSDPDAASRESIAAWTGQTDAGNINPPLDIDVTRPGWHELDLPDPVAAMVCINMIHIAPWEACLGLMKGAGKLLPTGGLLYLYGPFRLNGEHTAPSNLNFDRQLRAQDPAWGVRGLDDVSRSATEQGLNLLTTVTMPANNFSVIFQRQE